VEGDEVSYDNSFAWPMRVDNFVKFSRDDPREAFRVAYVCLTCSQAIMFNGTEGSGVGPELRKHAAIHDKANAALAHYAARKVAQ
jgi:hypothetical protein